MAGVNKVILLGRLGRDPEMRYTPDGLAITNFSIATSDTWTDKMTGDKREKTEWHRIVAFRRLAEICGEYLSKGKQVYVEGKLQTREWEDKDGSKRYTTEIIADTIQFVGGRDDGEYQGQPRQQPQPQGRGYQGQPRQPQNYRGGGGHQQNNYNQNQPYDDGGYDIPGGPMPDSGDDDIPF